MATYTLTDLERLTGIRTDTIRVWEKDMVYSRLIVLIQTEGGIQLKILKSSSMLPRLTGMG